MVTTKPVPLRVIGIPLRAPVVATPVVPGVDTPRGIESLDLDWFARALTVDRLAECDDAGLAVMRTEAQQYVALRAMQSLARTGASPGGGG